MDRNEFIEQANETLDETIVQVERVENVNYNPHPYMITPRHITADTMILNERTIRHAERRGARCGWKGCEKSYDEHTFDTVVFMVLTRDVSESEIHEELKKIVDLTEQAGFDGFGFLDTPAKYRIRKDRVLPG